MSKDKEIFKVIAATAAGVIAGILLGNYIWAKDGTRKPLSEQLVTLSNILEQIEGIDTEEAEDLKERINNILTTIESSYGITKK